MISLQQLAVFAVLLLPVHLCAQPLDKLSNVKYIQDTQLLQFLTHSIQWLEKKAIESNNTALVQYTQHLLQVQQPSCTSCVDYFEAVSLVRGMGKLIRELLEQDMHDIVYPAIRRSFVAAVWLLQRSKMFVWGSSGLETNVVGTMLRLYLHHVKRAQGRTISLHHISKCGGTSMCQLAATNKCSNPHLSIEKNCVLDDRLDSPIWMVAHEVNETGAFPDHASGVLDVTPSNPINTAFYNRLEHSTEPPLPMWLMYACPYQLTGQVYTCQARLADVRNSGTTFLAVERTLSPLGGGFSVGVHHPTTQQSRVQVCPEFINAVTLRQPVPHAISLMAEVKFRYMRQLQQKKITTWEPPVWNLTWWETFGPALVGSYATRTLIGRESFCRSAGNLHAADLHQAIDALLGFDMVMTLDRTTDIDMMVSALLGWPAKKFSSQPAKRVRTVASQGPLFMGLQVRRLMGDVPFGGDISVNGTIALNDLGAGHQNFLAAALEQLQTVWYTNKDAHVVHRTSSSSSSTPASSFGAANDNADMGSIGATVTQNETVDAADGDHLGEGDEDASMDGFDQTAAQYDMSFDTPFDEPPFELPAEVVEAQAALALVRTSVLDRQSQLLGYNNVSAALAAGAPVWEPRIEKLQAKSKHGAHQFMVAVNGSHEVWHAFPRHSFAFRAADMQRLELLTQIDAQLFKMADLMLDLDTAWLHAIMRHSHYKRKLQSFAHTYTACGFAGIIPQKDVTQKLLRI